MKFKDFLRLEYPFFIGVSPFVWQALFFYIPLVLILVMSVTTISFQWSHFTFNNYVHIIQFSYLIPLLRSIFLAVATTACCFIIGYPLAYAISFKGGSFKIVYLFLLMIPFWTNMLLHIYAWFTILDKEGLINNVLISFGVIKEPFSFLYSWGAIMVVMIYSYLPFMVLPLYSALEGVERRLLEASSDLGANAWQTLWHVLLPLSFPGIVTGLFLVMVPAFGEFVIPGLMGGERFLFIGSIVAQYIVGSHTLSLGAALTVISTCVLFVLLITVYYLLKRLFISRGA